MRDDEPRPVRMSLLITHTRRCASAGKIPWLEGMNPQTDHHRVVSRNPCESLSLILRQWLLWANISAGVTLQRSVSCCPSCCPSCSLALASLCGLAAAVGSGGRERGCMCLPHLTGEVLRVAPGRDSWKILQSCFTLEDSLPLQSLSEDHRANILSTDNSLRHHCKLGGGSASIPAPVSTKDQSGRVVAFYNTSVQTFVY